MAPFTVPHYEWLQDQAIDTLLHISPHQQLLVDLGGGSGRLTKKYLRQFPDSRAVIVDSSRAFLEVARAYLKLESDRITLIHAEIESEWQYQLPEAPTAIISMSCIHHLTQIEKQAVYTKSANALAKGGILLNIDEMCDSDKSIYRADLEYWWNYVNRVRPIIDPLENDLFEQFFHHFENWKIRNIDGFESPKQKGDDLHDTAGNQLMMLRKAGLINVSAPFHFRLWQAIVGQKN